MTTNFECDGVFHRVASEILKNLGKVGRSLSRDLLSGNHGRIPNVTINPHGYSDWREFFRDYQAASLLRKYPGLNLNVDRHQVAIDKFLKSEQTCRDTNQRLLKLIRSPDMYNVAQRAKSFIARILGDFSWDSAVQYFDFGPGANVGIPRSRSHLCNKIGNLNPTVTGDCSVLLDAYLGFDPHMGEAINDRCIVKGSRVTTVPKDARCDRVIAVEPQWNMFFQKGIGGMIRKRLKVIGLDIDCGQPRNQELARLGSLDGSLSTIDLASASDTIAKSLVELLLPSDWLSAMEIVRSPYCTLPNGDSLLLRKFSSMGNGFTFELESLIFLALCKAVYPAGRIGREILVYGDDIIFPSRKVPALIEALSFFGFTTNLEKTFIDGPFRESCGKHYFLGHDVTPFFFKKKIRSYQDMFWLTNSIKRLAFRFCGFGFGLDARFEQAWKHALNSLPHRFQSLSCPDGYGDDAVVRDFDECTPSIRSPNSGWEGYVSRYLGQRRRLIEHSELPALITKLWYTRRSLELGELSQLTRIQPSTVFRYYIGRRVYPQWCTLGPWVSGL